MTENKILMANARQSLTGKWETPILTYLVYIAINSVGGPIGLIIGGPMQLGSSIFSLNFVRGKKAETAQILDGFKNFGEALIAYLLILIYVALWSLLLLIPGIIAAISYSQTFYLMADNKDLKGSEAIKKSKRLMAGKKWKFFCLGLRFVGWTILAVLTLGVGFLWLIPYMNISFANFYEDIKG